MWNGEQISKRVNCDVNLCANWSIPNTQQDGAAYEKE